MPGAAHTFDLSDATEQAAYVDFLMDVDHQDAQLERGRRNATTTASVLGFVASALMLYDAALVVLGGHYY